MPKVRVLSEILASQVAAGEVVSGYPAIPNRLWLRCSAAFNKLPELTKAIRSLEKNRTP